MSKAALGVAGNLVHTVRLRSMTTASHSSVSVPGVRPWRCRDRAIELGAAPVIMGILNVTPDSFFDGGRHGLTEAALAQAKRMIAEGAAIIDVGGQSTRPGYVEISDGEEIARVVPVVTALVRETAAVISIDTYKPAVARAAFEAGAHILNDIHGLQRAPELAQLAAERGAAVVAMHHDEAFRELRGDVIECMKQWLARSLEIAGRAGVPSAQIALDPGIGFFKTQAQNLELIGRLGELRIADCALLLGASRKSFIGNVLGGLSVDERLEGTLATTAVAVSQGVEIVRVHDVAANLRAARLAHAIRAQVFPH
jgi:dihydropteroate synthase